MAGVDTKHGLVIDVRATSSGEAKEALEAASLFIDGGDMAASVGQDGRFSQAYEAMPGDILSGAPIVVVANNTTRGAAEIFAFALDARKRAVSVGSPTFGNVNIYESFQLSGGRGISFAVKSVYSADGYPRSKIGMQPLVCAYFRNTADETETFLSNAKEGRFTDNRARVKDPLPADVERARKNCPAAYPFARVNEAVLSLAVQILLEPKAYENLLSAERGF